MADADADAASDLAELIANAPEGDGAAPDAARAKQLREALKRAHDRALARSRAAAASAALLGDHRRGAQVSELVLGDAETVWQQLRLRGRDGDRHAVAAEHYLQRQAEAADDDDESDGDDEEDDAAADDEAAAESESASSSAASSSEEEESDAAEEDDEDEWADDVDEDDDDDEDEHEGAGIEEDRFFSLAGMEEFVAEDEALIAAGMGKDGQIRRLLRRRSTEEEEEINQRETSEGHRSPRARPYSRSVRETVGAAGRGPGQGPAAELFTRIGCDVGRRVEGPAAVGRGLWFEG